MTSVGNNFNYFPQNQLTKFIAVPLKFQWRNVRHPLEWTPLPGFIDDADSRTRVCYVAHLVRERSK